MIAVRLSFLGLLLVAWGACGGSSPSPDDGGNDGATSCTDDTECGDAFCDGVYRCRSGACERVSNTCGLEESCDEASRRCVRVCSTTRDADEDGFDAVECGGNDCDDTNPSRHPGSTEVCDVANEDEDCDPRTFGVRDADGDGFPDAACCNFDDAGDMRCGTDCDDTRADVRPGANDGCNGVDDDCDGSVDEAGAVGSFYPDCDGDGYGAMGAEARTGCMPSDAPTVCAGVATATWATQATDCDDSRASVSPGAPEVCDGLDNDCDPDTFAFGEDDDDDGYADAACGGDDCDDTCPTCHPDVMDELCDGLDNDCDEGIDEGVDPGLLRTFYRDADDDGVGTTSTTVRSCVAPTGYVAADGDCNDGEDRVGVCSAPMRCVRGTACGCEAVLLNNAQYLDLDSGRTWLPSDPYNGARDLLVNNGLLAQKFLQVTGTGRFYRRVDPSDYFSVDASYTATVLGTGEDPDPWTSSTVYVVDTGIYYYRLGFFLNESPVRFIYEPIGARPADFACQPL
ncbi:MAG: putative metal-binding motif-containing protein [Sandaracinus sp.]|nr:putative metal-binding motif-containing protein [Sandaracinus sp.]MCB9633329.1 putative metal-binding motif-containing protein [Sandaracinus sp.]